MKTANVYDLASIVSVVTDAGSIQRVFKNMSVSRGDLNGPVREPSKIHPIHLEGFPLKNYLRK